MVSQIDAEFSVEGNVTLHGWLFIPDAAGPRPAITMAPGFAGIREHGLDRFARVFAEALNSSKLQGLRFAIDGHTNAVGGRDYNLKLSHDRAQAVVDFLTSHGVDASRLEVNGYGFDRPVDPANPKAAINRRVEARRLN